MTRQLAARIAVRLLPIPGDASPSVRASLPVTEPIVVRDEVSPWAFIAVALFAATVTFAVTVAARHLRRRRAGSASSGSRSTQPDRSTS